MGLRVVYSRSGVHFETPKNVKLCFRQTFGERRT